MIELKGFTVQEFVSPDVYKLLGDRAISLIDEKMLISIMQIREYFSNRIFVNTWEWGGGLKERGFRTFKSGIGAKYSMHKYGRALDFDVDGVSAIEVRDAILAKPKLFPYITRMEDKVSWVHIDNKETKNDKIVLFNP